MASSKVMTSTTSTNSDLPRESSSSMCSLTIADIQTDQPKNLGSMNMEDLLKNIYSDSLSPDPFPSAAGAATGDGSFSLPKIVGNKTVDEVWKEIVAGGSDQRGGGGAGMDEMTLEDFLTKAGAGAGAGAVREEDVSLPVPVVVGPGSYGVDSSSIINGGHQMNGVRGGGGRAKRRAVEETVDKATQQKQRRMIKNRESAARSRERKQAYTVELESLVTQLEEENARLLREEAEESKKRFMQLMENLIPVVEKRRPPRVLRRVHSVQW